MVISMLVIGVLSILAFVIVEWRVTKLPMMPGKGPLAARSTLLQAPSPHPPSKSPGSVASSLTSHVSRYIPQSGRISHVATVLRLWCCLPGNPLLRTSVLAKCPRIFHAHVGWCLYPTRRGSIGHVGAVGLLHFLQETLRRGPVGWVCRLDPVSCILSLRSSASHHADSSM